MPATPEAPPPPRPPPSPPRRAGIALQDALSALRICAEEFQRIGMDDTCICVALASVRSAIGACRQIGARWYLLGADPEPAPSAGAGRDDWTQ